METVGYKLAVSFRLILCGLTFTPLPRVLQDLQSAELFHLPTCTHHKGTGVYKVIRKQEGGEYWLTQAREINSASYLNEVRWTLINFYCLQQYLQSRVPWVGGFHSMC